MANISKYFGLLLAFTLANLSLTLVSCSCGESNSEDICEIMGRSAILDFPGVQLQSEYRSETELFWKVGDRQGTERVSYKRLAPHIHFLNWIEQDGMTVSHIVNCKDNTVVSFISIHDENSDRGQRIGSIREGTVKFKD